MTAAYKYACFEAFCIPTEGSDDADSESHTVKSTKIAGSPSDGFWEQAESLGENLDELRAIAMTALEYWEIKDAKGALEFLSSKSLSSEAKGAINTMFPAPFRSAMKASARIHQSQAIEV
jgi:hypothetical protein